MTLVSASIANLINGVSQQPDILRLPSQGEVQINALSSPVEGLKKRPPSRFEFRVSTKSDAFSTTSLLSHQINRDRSEKYQVLLSGSDIRVFDLRSKERLTVKFKDAAKAYLQCSNPARDLRTVTVADYTFVLNRTKQVAMLPDVKTAYRPEALVWVKQGLYGAKYSITINGVTVTHLTPARAATEAEWTAGDKWEDENGVTVAAPMNYTQDRPRLRPQYLTAQYVTTDEIARELLNLLSNRAPLNSKFTFARSGSMIRIRPNPITTNAGTTYSDFTISTSDSHGDTVLKGYKDKVQAFSDLPARCFGDFRIKVMGDDATEFDDYYVRYEGNLTGGTWVEDIAAEERYKLDPTTMPHALIRQADGTFSFEAIQWEDRKAGDSRSIENPSIVGKKVTDLFFFRNRLGLVAQECVVMSRFGEYFNLFRASATQILDTDPIDVRVTHTKVSDIYHAVAYNETLVLFGEQTQFQIGATDLLTPKTVSFTQTTEFACDPDCRPVGLGSYLYFAHNRGTFAKLNEYFVDKESSSKNANDVTSHVPMFIPGELDLVQSCANENMLVALSNKDRKRLYVYSTFWGGEEKLQSSWSYWEFAGDDHIMSAHFVDSTLWVTLMRDGAIYMESLDLSPGAVTSGADYPVLLDRRVTEENVTVQYDNIRDTTFLTLPFPATSSLVIVAKDGNPEVADRLPGLDLWAGYVEGEKVEYTIRDDGRIAVPRRLERFWVGLPYTMRYQFSTQYLQEQDVGGGTKALVDGRLQLGKMTLAYVDSGYFRVEVTPKGRPTMTYAMTGKVIGVAETRVGRIPLLSGSMGFPVGTQNTQAKIEIVNDSFLPSSFISARWVGNYTPRTRRTG